MSRQRESSLASSNPNTPSPEASSNKKARAHPEKESVGTFLIPSSNEEVASDKPHYCFEFGYDKPVCIYSGYKYCFEEVLDQDVAIYRCIDMDQYVRNGQACPGSIRIRPKNMGASVIKPHNHAAGAPPSRTSSDLIKMAKERMSKSLRKESQLKAVSSSSPAAPLPPVKHPQIDKELAEKSISILNSIPTLEEIQNALSPGPPESEMDVSVYSPTRPPTGTVRRPVITIEDHRSESSASRSERFPSVGRQSTNDQSSSSRSSRRKRWKRRRSRSSKSSQSPSSSREPSARSFSYFQKHIISLSDQAVNYPRLSLDAEEGHPPSTDTTKQNKMQRFSREQRASSKSSNRPSQPPSNDREKKLSPIASKKKATTKAAVSVNVAKRKPGRPRKSPPSLKILQTQTERSVDAYINSGELEQVSSSNNGTVSEDSLPSSLGEDDPEAPLSVLPEPSDLDWLPKRPLQSSPPFTCSGHMYSLQQRSQDGNWIYWCILNVTDDHEDDAVEICPGRMELSCSSLAVISGRRHNHPTDPKECQKHVDTHLLRKRLEEHVIATNLDIHIAYHQVRESLVLNCSLEADLLPRLEVIEDSLNLLRRKNAQKQGKLAIQNTKPSLGAAGASRPEVQRAPSVALSVPLSTNGQLALPDVVAAGPSPSTSFDPYCYPNDSPDPGPEQGTNSRKSNRTSRANSPTVSPARNVFFDHSPSCSSKNYEPSPQSVRSTPYHSVSSPWTVLSSPANRQTPRSNSSIPSPSQISSPAQGFVPVRSQSFERAQTTEVEPRNPVREPPRESEFRHPYQNVFSPISPPPSETDDLNDEDLPFDALVTDSSPDLPELSPADVIAGLELEETDRGNRPGSSASLASFSELLRHLSDPTLPMGFGTQPPHINIHSANSHTHTCERPTSREITVLSCVSCQRQVKLTDKATETVVLPEEPKATVPQFAIPFTPPAVSGTDPRFDVQKICRDLEQTLSKLITHLESEPDDDTDSHNIVTQSLTGIIAKARNFLDRQANPQPKIVACTPRYAVVFDSDYSYGL